MPDEATELLAQWGWQENVFRTFTADATATATDPSYVEISLHRFTTATGASRALPYFARSRAQVVGQTEVPVSMMHPDEAAVVGLVEGGREATVYTRLDNVLVRVTAIVQCGYADQAAREISNAIAANAAHDVAS